LTTTPQQIEAIRYRPLEVAGGSMFKPSAAFVDASTRAAELEAELAKK
jgi:hypothetical protein